MIRYKITNGTQYYRKNDPLRVPLPPNTPIDRDIHIADPSDHYLYADTGDGWKLALQSTGDDIKARCRELGIDVDSRKAPIVFGGVVEIPEGGAR